MPHIGTFGEVQRTTMVMQAFTKIAPEIPTKLICFSDDLDGLRKIPDNIPNKDIVIGHLGKALTIVPDPYGEFASYGENMNNRLKGFLDSFAFEYDFYSSTECYKAGMFNDALKKVAENYDEISNLVKSTLREERNQNYSPLMPICPKSGKVLEQGVEEVDSENYTIKFKDEEGEIQQMSILDGNCKLQWKVDWGMRWHALEVDFEMYGKDLIDSATLSSKISKILGKKSPYLYKYEHFLDGEGKKISKSKGNGISMEDWLAYAPVESLAYYMFQKPNTQKRLYFEIIPKSTDEYLSFLSKYNELEDEKKIDNPLFHIHNGDVPQAIATNISFSLLLNLAAACNPENDDILWGFISKYDASLEKGKSKFFDNLVVLSIKYYNDFVKAHKQYRQASEIEKKAILELKENLKSYQGELDAKLLTKSSL